MSVDFYNVAKQLNDIKNVEVLSCEDSQIDLVVYSNEYRGTTGYITGYIDGNSIKIYKSLYLETGQGGFVKSRQIIQRELVDTDEAFIAMIIPYLNATNCIKN